MSHHTQVSNSRGYKEETVTLFNLEIPCLITQTDRDYFRLFWGQDLTITICRVSKGYKHSDVRFNHDYITFRSKCVGLPNKKYNVLEKLGLVLIMLYKLQEIKKVNRVIVFECCRELGLGGMFSGTLSIILIKLLKKVGRYEL